MARGPIKRQTLSVLLRRGVPVQTVIDVGVLSGTPELMEAYPDRVHLLFEPVAEFADGIEEAYRGIRHHLVQAAVSDHSGQIFLATATVVAGQEITHSYMTTDAARAGRTVPMVSLDDYFRTAPASSPYLLKIDIDGEEMRVLRGAGETLSRSSVVIIEAYVDSIAEKVSFLTDAGFRLFDLTEPCYYDDSLWQCDAVFINRSICDQYFRAHSESFEYSKYSVFNGL